MMCQNCGKPMQSGSQQYHGMNQSYCMCQVPQRGYMESDHTFRQTVSLAAITVELSNQRAMLQEILALLKKREPVEADTGNLEG